jgi:hypothetical protein
MPYVGLPAQRPNVHMDVNFYAGEPGNKPNLIPVNQPGLAGMMDVVKQTVASSGLFQQVSYDGPANPGDLHLTLRVYDHCDTGVAIVSSLVTGLSLGLVPSVATDSYTLQLEVSDSRGQTLSSVGNEDSTRTYVGLAFLTVSGHKPEQSQHEVLANQVRAALKEAYDAGKLVAVNNNGTPERGSDIPPVAGVK